MADPTLEIAPGFDYDGTFVCPVCHEHGDPEEYEAHLATHNTLIEACVQSVQDLNAATPDDPLPDVQRALELVNQLVPESQLVPEG